MGAYPPLRSHPLPRLRRPPQEGVDTPHWPPREEAKLKVERSIKIIFVQSKDNNMIDVMYAIVNFMQTALAPPPVVQAPPPTESAIEPELVGDHDGMGLAVGIVSQLHHMSKGL